MSIPGPSASSNVDILRLQYPRSMSNVIDDCTPDDTTVEIRHPAGWIRLMATQHRTAQRDLRQLHQACGGQFNRNDSRIKEIERNYNALYEGTRYLFERYQADRGVAHSWLRTELSSVASAAQAFTHDVWEMIQAKNNEGLQNWAVQAIATSRLHDAIVFLETADRERQKEQALYRQNQGNWPASQQPQTAQLAADQQNLRGFLETADRERQKEQALYRQNQENWPASQQPQTAQLAADQQNLRGEVGPIRDEDSDPWEGSRALQKMWALRYEGDIKSYFTTFRALNLHAKVNGVPLQHMIDQAMPEDIIDMRFAHNPSVFRDDEPFLRATYEAGRSVERLKALQKTKREWERRGSSGGGPGGWGSIRDPRGPARAPKSRGRKGRGVSGGNGQAGQGPGKGTELWESVQVALVGVPQEEIAEHKKSKYNCLRCGRTGHRCIACYAATTAAGTTLPTVPSGLAYAMRSRGVGESAAPPRKQAKLVVVKVEDEE